MKNNNGRPKCTGKSFRKRPIGSKKTQLQSKQKEPLPQLKGVLRQYFLLLEKLKEKKKAPKEPSYRRSKKG
jgi:hypothetical protein